MEELVLLLNKNKKEIISYFERNNINYKLEKNTFTYEVNMFDNKFKVEIRLFHKTARGIKLYCNSLKTTNYEKFLNLINDTKNKVNSLYGSPDVDSTNHLSETVTISYRNDNIFQMTLVLRVHLLFFRIIDIHSKYTYIVSIRILKKQYG